MPIVKSNPQWWVLEIFDGFGAHLNSLEANQIRADNKVLSLKEEADTSHINQAYDKFAARADKRVQRQNLRWLLKDRQYCSNIVGQTSLISCGLAAVRHTSRNPDVWRKSFMAVNLHPMHMLSFKDWCKKIEKEMQAGDTFDLKMQDNNAIDEYNLLPGIWKTMAPALKQTAVNIVQKHSATNPWGVQCCSELVESLPITLSDIPALQPAIFQAIENPDQIARVPDEQTNQAKSLEQEQAEQDVKEAESTREKINEGLTMFMCKPPRLKGPELFNHMIPFRQRDYATKEGEHKISEYLMCSPRNAHQRALMKVNYDEKMMGSLKEDLQAGVPLVKAAAVRLDNLGLIRGRSGFINDPSRLARQRDRLELQRSLGRREEIEELLDRKKVEAEKSRLRDKLPMAIEMYCAGETGKRAFTKELATAMLLVTYNKPMKSGTSKKELLEELDRQAADNPAILAAAADEMDISAAKPSAKPKPMRTSKQIKKGKKKQISTEEKMPPLPSPCQSVNNEANSGVASTVANALRPTAHWLYYRCVDARERMECQLGVVQLALLVLNAIKKCEAKGNMDETMLQLALFGALKPVTKTRDFKFISDVQTKAAEIISDGLSETDLMGLVNA